MDSNNLPEELIRKYVNGSSSEEERAIVESWHLNDLEQSTTLPNGELITEISVRIRENVLGHARGNTSRIARLWPRIAAAAAIIIVIGGGLLFYNAREKTSTEMVQNDIAPGGNGATLTLSDGRKILINDALTGKIASELGVRISKSKDGQLIYEVVDDNSSAAAYNTLSTSRGEQTQVHLPDGTLVFLNAESSLKYPTSFAKLDIREVTLTGEGYFEVAKDKSHPFIVESDGQKVEVLGTHFNIRGYKGDNLLKTTLIEGSVKVSSSKVNAFKVLSPGEQSRISGNSISVNKVNVEDELAWKLGVFQYDGETLENIMKDVERWYNVNVIYKDESIRKEQFYVTANRYDKVSGMLELLERTKIVSFKLKGKEITVEKK